MSYGDFFVLLHEIGSGFGCMGKYRAALESKRMFSRAPHHNTVYKQH